MVNIQWNKPILMEALKLWTGYDYSSFPIRNDLLLKEKFGDDYIYWLGILKNIVKEFYNTDAHLVASDNREMLNMAVKEFKRKYNEVGDDIIEILSWCYSYDYR